MDASSKSRAFNRPIKKNTREATLGNASRVEKGAWSAKSKKKSPPSASFANSGVAAGATKGKVAARTQQPQQENAAKENVQGEQGRSTHIHSKAAEKGLDRPAAVFIDLSCLRPQHCATQRLA